MRLRTSPEVVPTVSARDVIEMAGTPEDDRGDVTYCRIDSPLGSILAVATRVGLITLSYEASAEKALNDIARAIPGSMTEATTHLDEVRLQLDEYFARQRQSFELPIDWVLVTGYARDVLKATAEIGYGHVMSYGQVAVATGREKAVRATGNALGSNPIPIVIPCHRVIRSDGTIGGYTGGVEKKQFLMALEGISL